MGVHEKPAIVVSRHLTTGRRPRPSPVVVSDSAKQIR